MTEGLKPIKMGETLDMIELDTSLDAFKSWAYKWLNTNQRKSMYQYDSVLRMRKNILAAKGGLHTGEEMDKMIVEDAWTDYTQHVYETKKVHPDHSEEYAAECWEEARVMLSKDMGMEIPKSYISL